MYVNDYYVRRYTKDDLPREIKSRLTMIKAVGYEPYPSDHSVYNTTPHEDMREIGWSKASGFYCVVLPKDVLDKLRGEK